MDKNKVCIKCGKELTKIHAKGLCYSCYKKQWRKTNNKKVCKKCGRLKLHHANGLCSTCYTKLFYPELTKELYIKRNYKIPFSLYKKITKKCIICDFDKIVDLHHLDSNHKNILIENFVGLCPNHHKMIHTLKFKDTILKLIKKKTK